MKYVERKRGEKTLVNLKHSVNDVCKNQDSRWVNVTKFAGQNLVTFSLKTPCSVFDGEQSSF